MSYVAFQYAEALFALALEETQVDQVLEGYQSFVDALDTEIYTFLNHPKVTKKDKKDVLEKVISNNLLKHFVYVLIDNSRNEFIVECLEAYKQIVDEQNKVMNVVVYSGKPLTKQELSNLASNLKKKHNRNVELENSVDPSIIGGIRVEYEGMVFDDTINNYLQTLKNNLTK